MSEGMTEEIDARGTKRKREANGTRRRTSLACDICRKQKEKCEGGQPCWRCQRLDRRCEFSSQSGPLKPRHSLHLSPTPKRLNEHQRNLEIIVEHFLGDVSLDEENIARIAAKCTSETMEIDTFDDMNESPHVHFVSSNVAFYSGEFSHWNFSEKLRRTMRCRNTADSSVKEYWRATHLQSSLHTAAEAMTQLPPRPIAEFLVGLFFKYTELNSFYVERRWLQEKLQLCYNPSTEFTAADTPWVCTIFAVLAIGTQFAHMEEDRSSPTLSEEIAICSEDSVGLGFFHVACRLGPDVILAASYESVQAFLLLAVYALPVSCGAFIELVSWTGEVADALAKFKRCPKRLLLDYSTRLVQLRTKIRQWWTSLPINIQSSDNLQGTLFRQNCHMKLCYLLIYIYMGRPFIFNTRDKENPLDHQNVGKTQQSELVNECVQSALEIIEVLQSLADNFGLCRASYTEFSSCRAALLVILAESINSGRSQKLRDILNRGMILLRQMTGGTSTQSEISYIESIEAAIQEWSSNGKFRGQEANTGQSSRSAYATFKDWTQSMKKDKNIGSTMELSSFSPISHMTPTSSAESVYHSDMNDLTDLLNPNWATDELGLDPDVFLAP
ncbi:hypothetical protein N7520_005700 [Penicillium odoratum]|uniref:uncharacterized protein n=1 Tax=Penicillium odoratum TaxID=1167516 RepID=UPI0025487AA4|nr:uncharacterized protein N7520_005700 [Penicillium odoratum]KAJ5758544.1 hypothetical protein N7520_005700 [Penicillium odoratum]